VVSDPAEWLERTIKLSECASYRHYEFKAHTFETRSSMSTQRLRRPNGVGSLVSVCAEALVTREDMYGYNRVFSSST